MQKMEGREERKRGGEEYEDEDDQFEDEEELMRESKRKWWKRVYSLLMRSETAGEGSTSHGLGRDIVVRNGSPVNSSSSPFKLLVIHPDNWYEYEFLFIVFGFSNCDKSFVLVVMKVLFFI